MCRSGRGIISAFGGLGEFGFAISDALSHAAAESRFDSSWDIRPLTSRLLAKTLRERGWKDGRIGESKCFWRGVEPKDS